MKKGLIYLFLLLISSYGYSQNLEKTMKKVENGIKYLEKGKYKKAIKQYSSIIETHDNIWQAYAVRGNCYYFTNETKKGLHDFLKAYSLDSNQSFLLNQIAVGYEALKQHKQAIEYYKRALSKNFEFTYFEYFSLGSAYYFLAEMDSAIHYLEISRDLDSVNSLAGDNLAWAYLDSDPVKSCFFFNEAYLKDTLDSRKINNLGYSHLLCGNLEEAFTYFKKAKKLDRNNSFIYRNFGLYYMKKGQKEEACKNLQKSIDLKIVEEWGDSYISELKEYCQ